MNRNSSSNQIVERTGKKRLEVLKEVEKETLKVRIFSMRK
jgi:hypothetical protein